MRASRIAAAAGLVASVAGAALLTVGADAARACAIAASPGVEVEVAGESALIVWDPATKTEHFIREARFNTSSGPRDFGFLVPTPTRPELTEASSDLFSYLEYSLEKDLHLPMEPVLLLGVGGLVVVRWRRRRAAAPKKGDV